MKLNQEIVRNLLLFVENCDSAGATDKLLKEFEKNNNYTEDDVVYTIKKLKEANYVNACVKVASGKIHSKKITSLTWDGHKFLDNIRDPKVWKAAKSTSSKLASVSIEIISSIAADIVVKVLNGKLNL